jgi:hypothetical protein
MPEKRAKKPTAPRKTTTAAAPKKALPKPAGKAAVPRPETKTLPKPAPKPALPPATTPALPKPAAAALPSGEVCPRCGTSKFGPEDRIRAEGNRTVRYTVLVCERGHTFARPRPT